MALTMAALAAAFQALEQTARGEMVAVLGRLLASADMRIAASSTCARAGSGRRSSRWSSGCRPR